MPKPRPASSLAPNPQNPRKITDAKLEQLSASLQRFGDLSGVVFNVAEDAQRLVGGHQRIKALPPDAQIVIDREYDRPTRTGTVREGHVVVDGERFAYREVAWDSATEKAANLSANKGAGEFDLAVVAEWMQDLDDVGFDLDLTMFDADERAALQPEPEKPVEVEGQDEAPEVADKPWVTRGDLFILGDHRLLCGDSTVITDVERAMGGQMADAVWTDPPYGIDYLGGSKKRVAITNDGEGDLEELLTSIVACGLAVCSKGAAWYVAAPAGPQTLAFAAALKEAEIWRQTIVWVKNNSTFGRSDYHWRHEIIYYGWVPGGPHHAVEDRKQDTVWEVDRPPKSPEHPTMKPLALIERALLNSTHRKGVVVDFFGGSGSTMLACEKTGRRNVSIEIDPGYCQVIIERWEGLTGRKAVAVAPDGVPRSSGTAEALHA